jgi:hypothetical protein
MKALRYDNLVAEIDRVKPARIVEVGTCKGERAEMMIRAALKHRFDVEYIGFDLFEPPPEAEFSARAQPATLEKVTLRLAGLGAKVTLVDGLDREAFAVTLLEPVDVFRKPYGELRTQMVKVIAR